MTHYYADRAVFFVALAETIAITRCFCPRRVARLSGLDKCRGVDPPKLGHQSQNSPFSTELNFADVTNAVTTTSNQTTKGECNFHPYVNRQTKVCVCVCDTLPISYSVAPPTWRIAHSV